MTTMEERIASELKELAWEHHAPIEDRLNVAANHLNSYGGLETSDVTELQLIVSECEELAERVAKVLRVVREKELSYAV